MSASKRRVIILTAPEITSNYNRQKSAEGLIVQLPVNHDGRNSWLLNYGIRDEAAKLRSKRNLKWDKYKEACETTN